MSPREQPDASLIPPFLRDIRVLQALGQIIFVIVVVAATSRLAADINAQLQAKNLLPTFAFLENRAGFDISEKPDWYTSDSSYGAAFQVGLINTLRIVVVGLVLTTLLGLFVGIFLLSSNWLVRRISQVYVEVLRNTPLLTQLFAWYFILMFSLPVIQQAITLPSEGVALISVRVLIYAALYIVVWLYVRGLSHDNPLRAPVMAGALAAVIVIEAAFWLHRTQPSWAAGYGSGDLSNATFLVYAAASLVLIGLSLYMPEPRRLVAVGASIGQAVGGLLFFFGVIPDAAFRFEVYPSLYISVRGFVFPSLLPTARFAEWMAFVGLGVVLALIIWVYSGRIIETTGRVIPRGWYALLALVGFVVVGWVLVGTEPGPAVIPVQQEGATVYMTPDEARAQALFTTDDELLYSRTPMYLSVPQERRNRTGALSGFDGGTQVSIEYMALLLGLVIYTSAFVAEIVRAGILAVPKGQLEAARALGLNTPQLLRLVILPQALRVIIPPLGNQYLNLAKNSSLALAIAYSDLLQVSTTMMNQSGQTITGFLMLMVAYLTMSLSISLVMNLVNRRFQLVTR